MTPPSSRDSWRCPALAAHRCVGILAVLVLMQPMVAPQVSLWLDHLVWHLLLRNLLDLCPRLWLGLMCLRGSTLRDLLWILLKVPSSSSIIASIVVRVRIRVTAPTVDVGQQLYDEVVVVLDHLLLVIIAHVELLNLLHSLRQSAIHSHC
jgi:hypothetical protein